MKKPKSAKKVWCGMILGGKRGDFIISQDAKVYNRPPGQNIFIPIEQLRGKVSNINK